MFFLCFLRIVCLYNFCISSTGFQIEILNALSNNCSYLQSRNNDNIHREEEKERERIRRCTHTRVKKGRASFTILSAYYDLNQFTVDSFLNVILAIQCGNMRCAFCRCARIFMRHDTQTHAHNFLYCEPLRRMLSFVLFFPSLVFLL